MPDEINNASPHKTVDLFMIASSPESQDRMEIIIQGNIKPSCSPFKAKIRGMPFFYRPL